MKVEGRREMADEAQEVKSGDCFCPNIFFMSAVAFGGGRTLYLTQWAI